MNILTDTSSKFAEKYLALQRNKNIAEKLSQVDAMRSFIINLSKNRIKHFYPALDQKDVDLIFIKYNFGEKIAEAVRNYVRVLDEKKRNNLST
jgi:hypothetical protein